MRYKVKVSGKAETAARSRFSAGNNEIVIDEPKERHGTDEGASPLEHLVAALCGCTNVISSRIADEMGIILQNSEIEAIADLDGAVLSGDPYTTVFPTVRLNVTTRTNASESQIEDLKQQLSARCPVAAMMRLSGAKMIDSWTLLPVT